jgi:CRP-like cAMP-binding protein
MAQQQSLPLRTASPGEVIFSEGAMGNPLMYVIKEGSVEISITRGERKVVLSTLGRGQFFGEMALLIHRTAQRHGESPYLLRIPGHRGEALERLIDKSSPIVRYMLRTLISMVKKKDELVARHAMGFSVVVAYAQLLELDRRAGSVIGENAARARSRSRAADRRRRRQCMRILRHSRQEVLATLKHMFKLGLITIESGRPGYRKVRLNDKVVTMDDGKPAYQMVRFNHEEIVRKAQNLPESANQELAGYIRAELELVDLAEIEELTGIDRSAILRKLTQDESASDLFVFRKSAVLRYWRKRAPATFPAEETCRECGARNRNRTGMACAEGF